MYRVNTVRYVCKDLILHLFDWTYYSTDLEDCQTKHSYHSRRARARSQIEPTSDAPTSSTAHSSNR